MSKKLKFLPFGKECLDAIQACENFLFEISFMPKSQWLLNVDIEAIPDAVFDLNEGQDQRLAPIIFSHGFCGIANHYSGHCRELASFGYVVFAPDMIDGSATYTKTKDGKVVDFDMSRGIYDVPLRTEQLKQRVQHQMKFIDEISQNPLYLQETLGFPQRVKLDLNKLVMCGNSFGGSTAIGTSLKDNRVKATIVNDPWFEPLMSMFDYKKMSLAKPIQALHSIDYYTLVSNYENETVTNEFIARSRSGKNTVE